MQKTSVHSQSSFKDIRKTQKLHRASSMERRAIAQSPSFTHRTSTLKEGATTRKAMGSLQMCKTKASYKRQQGKNRERRPAWQNSA